MSLETAAKRLAAKGRKGDTLLVHMHPKEVAGLQALALKNGTSMTINPSTGLPEAFGLKNILPMVAGVVGGMYGGPWGGAAASAGMTKMMGGSDRNALMSGIGGYMGSGAMGSAAGEVAGEGLAGAAGEGMAGAAAEEGAVQLAGPGTELMQNPETGEFFNPAGSETTVAQPIAPAPAEVPLQTGGPRDTTMGQDFASWKEKMGGEKGLGKAGIAALMQAQAVAPDTPDKQRIPGGIQHYTFDPAQQGGAPVDSRERKQFGNVFTRGAYEDRSRYMAAGGIARLASGGSTAGAPAATSTTGGYTPAQIYGPGQSGGYDPRSTYGADATMKAWTPPTDAAASTDAAQMYRYDPSTHGFALSPTWQATQEAKKAEMDLVSLPGTYYANGGPIPGSGQGHGSNLGSFSDGGQLLQGAGNGTSDSIPATIDGHQPARLASGEFVVPARIVSELGNGSTDAGSKELYAMLDRIQKARGKTVGKNKVAHDAKARNALPA